jgi:hypothetical protein
MGEIIVVFKVEGNPDPAHLNYIIREGIIGSVIKPGLKTYIKGWEIFRSDTPGEYYEAPKV